MSKNIDIGFEDLNIYVDGQKILHIGQVSDEDVVNLFLCPEGKIFESKIPGPPCTHELIVSREHYDSV